MLYALLLSSSVPTDALLLEFIFIKGKIFFLEGSVDAMIFMLKCISKKNG